MGVRLAYAPPMKRTSFLIGCLFLPPAWFAQATEEAAPAPLPAAATNAPATLALADLLKAALAHDGRVLAAHAQLDEYRALLEEASWLWFPVAKFEALFGAPVGERKLNCDPGVNQNECLTLRKNWRPGSFDFGQTSFAIGGKLEAALPLYTFGKLTEAKRAARAGVAAGESGIGRARQEIAVEVRRAYHGWRLANAALDILLDGRSKLEEAESKLQKMLDEMNVDVSDTDLFKLRYYRSQVETMLLDAQKGRALAVLALGLLTGLPGLEQEGALRPEEWKADAQPLATHEECLARAKQQRPEFRQLSAALEAATAALGLAKAQFYPDFFLAGNIQGSYSPVQDFIKNPLLNNGLTNYDAGLALGMRVTLDIPQKRARLHREQAALARARAQVDRAREAIAAEIQQRLEEKKNVIDRLSVLRKGNRSAKAWMRANFISYGVGLSNTGDLLDSLAAYAKSQMDLDKAQHDVLLAHEQLALSVGEDLTLAP